MRPAAGTRQTHHHPGLLNNRQHVASPSDGGPDAIAARVRALDGRIVAAGYVKRR